ncbi:MAG TPA: 16S rRNA (guanine(527)-N(7))-methyltransferase RsmG [Synergistaceae bacterium]|nr:16S rRNA (guanine(527)-N(7))-methyltransferase RsmG [Synergistaceae bacterium]HPJ25325.1 16S rRNA (guanine(527)-N(7))-methyltransferase RsmG [Synergistaceae bacterium]HPQ36375.1 16S rRNA (guanine(527)-N(7))-methyltransferase RsmG [Synergistaceae bacterium]
MIFILSHTLEENLWAPLLEEKKALLEKYMALLLEANRQIRLVGPWEEETLWKKHILDCIPTLSLLPPRGKVVDLGSGAGLPGMIWAICRPDLEVVLCESIRKKAAFLERTASLLELSSCRIVAERSEELARRERESFDLAGARAVSHLGVVAEYAAPLVAPGGFFLAMKGEKGEEEAREIGSKWKELGFSEPRIWEYTLEEGERHYVIGMNKTAKASEKYPRRPGMAEKRRWW